MDIKEIRENKFNIDAIRHSGTYGNYFYWVDYVDEEEEIFYCFLVEDGYKQDKEFTFFEIAKDTEKFKLYGLYDIETEKVETIKY